MEVLCVGMIRLTLWLLVNDLLVLASKLVVSMKSEINHGD
jgi:hypothetical protein